MNLPFAKKPAISWLGSPLLSICLLLVAVMEVNSAELPQFNKDLSVDEIMAYIVMPAADALWSAVSIDMTTEGEVVTSPQSDEDWERLHEQAVKLVASTNLLLIPGLPIAAASKSETTPAGELSTTAIGELRDTQNAAWTAHVMLLHDIAMQALSTIVEHDADALSEVGGDLDAACEGCHLQFWYPEN